jgi:hypothetical protein
VKRSPAGLSPELRRVGSKPTDRADVMSCRTSSRNMPRRIARRRSCDRRSKGREAVTRGRDARHRKQPPQVRGREMAFRRFRFTAASRSQQGQLSALTRRYSGNRRTRKIAPKPSLQRARAFGPRLLESELWFCCPGYPILTRTCFQPMPKLSKFALKRSWNGVERDEARLAGCGAVPHSRQVSSPERKNRDRDP